MANRFLETRLVVLERDNYTCQECGEHLDMVTKGHYAVHHLDYSSDEPANLISLCTRCHRITHTTNDIEKRPSNTKPIKFKDETYWQLREMRDEMSKEQGKAFSFDDVVQYLFTRRLTFQAGSLLAKAGR